MILLITLLLLPITLVCAQTTEDIQIYGINIPSKKVDVLIHPVIVLARFGESPQYRAFYSQNGIRGFIAENNFPLTENDVAMVFPPGGFPVDKFPYFKGIPLSIPSIQSTVGDYSPPLFLAIVNKRDLPNQSLPSQRLVRSVGEFSARDFYLPGEETEH